MEFDKLTPLLEKEHGSPLNRDRAVLDIDWVGNNAKAVRIHDHQGGYVQITPGTYTGEMDVVVKKYPALVKAFCVHGTLRDLPVSHTFATRAEAGARRAELMLGLTDDEAPLDISEVEIDEAVLEAAG